MSMKLKYLFTKTSPSFGINCLQNIQLNYQEYSTLDKGYIQ